MLDAYTARLADLQLAVAPVTQRTQVGLLLVEDLFAQRAALPYTWLTSRGRACRPCRRLELTSKRRESGRRKCSATSTQRGRHALGRTPCSQAVSHTARRLSRRRLAGRGAAFGRPAARLWRLPTRPAAPGSRNRFPVTAQVRTWAARGLPRARLDRPCPTACGRAPGRWRRRRPRWAAPQRCVRTRCGLRWRTSRPRCARTRPVRSRLRPRRAPSRQPPRPAAAATRRSRVRRAPPRCSQTAAACESRGAAWGELATKGAGDQASSMPCSWRASQQCLGGAGRWADWLPPRLAGSDAGLEEEGETLPGVAAARLRSLAEAVLRNSEPTCFKVYCEARGQPLPAHGWSALADALSEPFQASCMSA